MLVEALWAAFDHDDALVQAALHLPPGRDGGINPNLYRIKRKKLVDILLALQVTEENPGRFPDPVDWRLYKAERQRRRKPAAKPK